MVTIYQEHFDAHVVQGAQVDMGQITTVRRAVRLVLRRGDTIAIIRIPNQGFHELPGGGVAENETLEEAVSREAREETGASIDRLIYYGMILSYRQQQRKVQIDHIFAAEVVGELREPSPTAEECAEGHALLWVRPREALTMIENDAPNSYSSKYTQLREKAILSILLGRHTIPA